MYALFHFIIYSLFSSNELAKLNKIQAIVFLVFKLLHVPQINLVPHVLEAIAFNTLTPV